MLLRPDLGFWTVADGMGGAASGEVASAIFVEEAAHVFTDNGSPTGRALLDLVQEVFLLANDRVYKESQNNPAYSGMGCTAELLAFDGESYIVGHVGDSRTYLWRQGIMRQVTKDHSIVQEQIDKGLITLAEAKTHAMRNVIMRAIGVNEELAVDLIRGKARLGDLFLLCSDGLSDMLEDDMIKELLSLPVDLDDKSQRLVEAANLAGGYDNITVVLCEIAE
jgi:PPM family protein phosphatase